MGNIECLITLSGPGVMHFFIKDDEPVKACETCSFGLPFGVISILEPRDPNHPSLLFATPLVSLSVCSSPPYSYVLTLTPGNGAHINYLSRASSTRLNLIQGDGEVFSDVLSLIGEYEGVLSRHESLAGNLGAKLTGPRLVRAMEGLFEEPIRITRRDPYTSEPVAWLDVVQFAKSNPNEFNLMSSPDRGRYCTFYLKGNQVEITEDDWRLIMSGTLDRFNLAPPQPLEEDENSELATLEILELRLQVLIKRADEVARKARQLNYHLSGRKAAINSRRTVPSPPARNAGFQPLNHQHSQISSPKSTYDLHADLLQQFTSSQPPRVSAQNSVSLPTTPIIQVSKPVLG